MTTILYNQNGSGKLDKEAYEMKKLTKEQAEKIYLKVAIQRHTTVDDIKKQIKLAMIAGMCNQNPEIQKRWREIPHDGDVPTPEELLIFMSSKVHNGF